MRRIRTVTAALTAVTLTLTVAVLAAPSAAAYTAPIIDVTNRTVSDASGPNVVRVTRTIVEVPGVPGAPIPTVAFQYRMDPTTPESTGGTCQLYRDGTLMLDKSCAFLSGFFEDALKNPASGRYELMSAGKKVSSWTYTAPKTSQPPALKPAGCKITGLKVTAKPRTVTATTDAFGRPTTTYTMTTRGTRTGNCTGVQWTAYITYSVQTTTSGIAAGFMPGDLTWSGNALKTLTFTVDKRDAKITDYDFALQLNGVTPGWRANYTTTTKFTVKP